MNYQTIPPQGAGNAFQRVLRQHSWVYLAFVAVVAVVGATTMMRTDRTFVSTASAIAALPALDSSSSANTGSNTASTLTWNHTTGSGADRLLLVGVSIRNSNSQIVNSVKYNNISLVKVKDAKNGKNARAELWQLVNPPSGTFSVVATLSGSARFVAGATSYTGVNQATPLGAAVGAIGSNTTPTVTVASAANELAVDIVASRNTTYALIVGSGQTQRYQNATTNSTASNNIRGGGSTEPGASSVVLSWTLSGSTTWAIVGVSIKPAPVADTTPPVISNVNASSITPSSATISWMTDEPSDSQVEYGLDTNYGSQTTLDPALVTSHSRQLTGLESSTLYHYRVKSKDASGNLAVSGDFTFTTAAPAATPNIILIMSDNQEEASLAFMPFLNSLITQVGTFFSNFTSSYPLCCPSRSTLFTGQYAHNHGVTNNILPRGGFAKLDHSNTLPIWLKGAGYYTGHIGKYLNRYGIDDSDPNDTITACEEIPSGWDEWYGAVDPSYVYYDYILNENGVITVYGDTSNLPSGCTAESVKPAVYQTDQLVQHAVSFINSRAAAGDGKLFFLNLSVSPPHGVNVAGQPYPEPAPRHQGMFDNEPLPQPPSFNEADVSDKPSFIQSLPLLSGSDINNLTEEYRDRLEAMQAVDEGIQQIVAALQATGLYDNTIIIYTSDQGRNLGEHRVNGLIHPYEESTQIPFIISGPGIPAGLTLNHVAGNVDVTPTILELAGAVPGLVQDGRSLLPIIADPGASWRTTILHEAGVNASLYYYGARTATHVYFDHVGTAQEEMYDLVADPYQLQSIHNSSDPNDQLIKSQLQSALNVLKTCSGPSCWY